MTELLNENYFFAIGTYEASWDSGDEWNGISSQLSSFTAGAKNENDGAVLHYFLLYYPKEYKHLM